MSQGCHVLNGAVTEASTRAFERADLLVVECFAGVADEGLREARELRRRRPQARIFILASESSEELAIEAVRLAAQDYWRSPVNESMVAEAVASCAEAGAAVGPASPIIGESAGMRIIKTFIGNAAASSSSVLILGESGTGKELVAEEVHRLSSRRHRPFVCINCAAIPDGLLESELFGYEKGAFTGAASSRDGKMLQGQGGTVFFDEIGDMTLQAQAKILRAIESREISPLGGHRGTKLDIRIIAATNRDLEAMVHAGTFRSDLYFRLNVARISLPPLRERRSDIPLLLEHLLPRYNRTFHARVRAFGPAALARLMTHSWPGNVRELKNVLEISFLSLAAGVEVIEHLPEQVLSMWRKLEGVPDDERERLLSALMSTRWNVSEAARKLHWSRMTMYRRLAKYQISPERSAPPGRRAATS